MIKEQEESSEVKEKVTYGLISLEDALMDCASSTVLGLEAGSI